MQQDTKVTISKDRGTVMNAMSSVISSSGKSIAILGVAVVVSVVAACGVFSAGNTPPAADVSAEVSKPRDWGPMAVIRDTTLGALDAQVGYGTLKISADCVILQQSGAEPSSPWHLVTIVWKSGRSGWHPPTGRIYSIGSAYSEHTLSDGDIISIGGGQGPDDIEDVEWIQRPHPDCPTELVWADYVSVEPGGTH